MKKIIVIIDALKYLPEKVREYDFLRDYNVKEVSPPFGFKPEATFLAGLSPETSNSGALHFIKSNVYIPVYFGLIKYFPERPPIIKKIIQKLLRRIWSNTGRKAILRRLHLANIPFRYLHLFVSRDVNWFSEMKFAGKETIFMQLRNKKIGYDYHGIPHSSGKLKDLKDQLTPGVLNSKNILWFYCGDLDTLGHRYGGNSVEYNDGVTAIFDFIQQLHDFYHLKGEEVEFVIFGDHGMCDITEVVDISSALKSLKSKAGKDYVYFLDSTIARFWFYNRDAQIEVTNKLNSIESGSWMSGSDFSEYESRYHDNRFGDAMWWCHKGIMISPNFWQGKKLLKGMHGYRKEVGDNNTMLITKKDLSPKKKRMNMIEIHKLLKETLGLDHG